MDGADRDGKPMNEEVRKAHRETATLFAGRYLNRASYEGYVESQIDEGRNKENLAIILASLKQFIISVSVTKLSTNNSGKEPVDNQHYSVDIVSENVPEFLAKLPDNIDERITISVSVTRSDGKTFSFADGTDKYGKPLDEESREAYRKDATLFAKRRSKGATDLSIV